MKVIPLEVVEREIETRKKLRADIAIEIHLLESLLPFAIDVNDAHADRRRHPRG